jgi:hypothetical protein
MSNALLPDVKETHATGRIAEIYDEIRCTLGVPMVNLIFRHMATIPGCLEWVWATIGPVYKSGAALRAAEQIATAQSPLPMNFGSVVESWHADMTAVRATCTAYVRANPANLVGLLALHLILTESNEARATRQKASATVSQTPPASLPALPPMGDVAALDATTKGLLMALTQQLHGDDGRVIPSFYRHFTAWPRLLNDVRAQVQHLIDSGALNTATVKMQSQAKEFAADLYRACPRTDLPEPPEQVRSTLTQLIELFPPNICKMTLIARAMERTLGQGVE